MIKRSVNLDTWIYLNTKNSNCVVELGDGFFKNLKCVHSGVVEKIGIEIYKPYIDNATYNDCVKIQGDILNYKELLKDNNFDTVMIVDVLEHFDKNVAFKLIEDLKKDFRKIILMLPFGEYEQHEDVTGFGGHEYQTHRSYWYNDDILKLGFIENIIDEDFHKGYLQQDDLGCYFGVWEK